MSGNPVGIPLPSPPVIPGSEQLDTSFIRSLTVDELVGAGTGPTGPTGATGPTGPAGAPVGGADTQILFNSSGSVSGTAEMVYDTTGSLGFNDVISLSAGNTSGAVSLSNDQLVLGCTGGLGTLSTLSSSVDFEIGTVGTSNPSLTIQTHDDASDTADITIKTGDSSGNTSGNIVLEIGSFAGSNGGFISMLTGFGVETRIENGGIRLSSVAVTQTTSITTNVSLSGSKQGVITTVNATLAANASAAFFVTSMAPTHSNIVILANIIDYTGTYGTNGIPVVSVDSIGATSCQIVISNAHATNALNGVLEIGLIAF